MEDEVRRKYLKLDNGVDPDAHATNNNGDSPAGSAAGEGKAWEMMRRMGWREGRGIGASEQGRAEPVAASSQVGRMGLGLRPASHDISGVGIRWTPGADRAAAEANMRFDFHLGDSLGAAADLVDGLARSPPAPELRPIQGLDGRYVDPFVIDCILKLKSRLDHYDDKVVRDARTRCNPYEALHSGQYMNRAALKLANINSMFNFMFTSEERRKGTLLFADVCAGPGGFSEYLLSQRLLTCIGFGFTLRGKDDFRKERMLMGAAESFATHYGARDDGDIYFEENMESLATFVRSGSGQPAGLHLVTADGGFDVTGQENNQEVLAKRLYLCQCLTALRLLQEGGDFVCKLFDMVTPFSMQLVFLMSVCFDSISIVKPVTSRPANSERYLVAVSRRGDRFVAPVVAFLRQVNARVGEHEHWEQLDVASMMPDDALDAFPDFVALMRDANNETGRQQALALSKLHQFIDNRNLIDDRQHDLRLQCLREWRLSAEPRPATGKGELVVEVTQLLSGSSPRDLLKQWRPLRQSGLAAFPKYSYKAMVLASEKPPVLLYSRGHGQVYYFNTVREMWRRTDVDSELEKARLSLPRQTIVLGQVVREISPKGTKKLLCLHLLDALVIYGEDVRDKNLIERHEKLQRMVAVLKEAMVVPISVPKLFRPYEPQTIMRQLKMERIKGFAQEKEVFEQQNGNLIIPCGVRLMKITREPWIIHMSRSNLKLYYFNTANRQSQFEPPGEGLCSYSNGVDLFVAWTSAAEPDADPLVPWGQFCEELSRSPRSAS